MADRKVTVKNMSSATVSINIPNLNFTRELKGENAKTNIPFDTLYEGLSDPGIMVLFDEGFLYIEDKQDRIDLGLEFEDESEPQGAKVMDSKSILEILERNEPMEIRTTLENLALEQRKKFAQVAIQNKIYNPGLAKFIMDYTGIDLLEAIQQFKELED